MISTAKKLLRCVVLLCVNPWNWRSSFEIGENVFFTSPASPAFFHAYSFNWTKIIEWMAIFKYRTFVIVGRWTEQNGKWSESRKEMGKSIEAKTMNDIERESRNERVRRKYHRTNILLYVNINSNRKSVFLLFSILFSR